jgi:hypothetical protein
MQLVYPKGQRAYRNARGVVFVFAVIGTQDEIADYQNVQGGNFRTEEGTNRPLFFSKRDIKPNTPLVKNRTGNGFYAQEALLEDDVQAYVQRLKALQAFTGLSDSALIGAAFNVGVASSTPAQTPPRDDQKTIGNGNGNDNGGVTQDNSDDQQELQRMINEQQQTPVVP